LPFLYTTIATAGPLAIVTVIIPFNIYPIVDPTAAVSLPISPLSTVSILPDALLKEGSHRESLRHVRLRLTTKVTIHYVRMHYLIANA
jgi:hypothetical protein